MSQTLPTIVLVHGAWHVPAHYQEFTDQLRIAGFEVFAPHLPTCNCTRQAITSMYDDAALVRCQVLDLIDRGDDVIMVLHSYGGAVGTEAVRGLSKAERRTNGQKGGVIHLLYMCAFILQLNESVGSASLPRPDPDPVFVDESNGTTFICEPPIELFYADVGVEKAKKMESMLTPQSVLAMKDTITYRAWKDIPTTYLMTLKDQVLFPEWQMRQIQAVRNTGTTITVKEYDCSHSPFLSKINEMVEIVKEIVRTKDF